MAVQQPKSKKGGREDAPYNLPPAFERAITFVACTNPRFMTRVGHEVRPELLGLKECQLAMEAAQAILRERGSGPSMPASTIQWVAARREDGKVTHADVVAVAGLFDTFDDKPAPSASELEPLLIDVVRKRLRFGIAQAAIREHNEGEWDDVQELMRREQALGQGESGIGIHGTFANAKEALARIRAMKKIPFGISELDAIMDGGAPRGTLTCLMAGPGGAKSMAMTHCAARQGIIGLFCGIATLELPSAHVLSRVLANQTGVTINEIIAGSGDGELEARLHAYKPCPPIIQDFEPHITTPDTIFEWAENIEKQFGRPLDVLYVDYADKLTASGKIDEKGMYAEMRVVYEKLRRYCDKNGLTGVTASQSRARDEKKAKVIDLEHTADSMHKARVVDQFITLNLDEDTKEMTFFVAKNRFGEGRRKAGPMPTTFATGQVAPVERQSLSDAAVRLGAPISAVLPLIQREEPGSDG